MADEKMDENQVAYSVSVKDAVVKVKVDASVDIVDILREMSKDHGNGITNTVVEIVALAKDKADWKGYAKTHVLTDSDSENE